MSNMPRTILFVGPEQPGAFAVSKRLYAAQVPVETMADVYLALARWGRGIVRPAAVIVCVDFLQPEEFEFFHLAARHYGPTPVYACGSPPAAGKLEQAVRSGARGVLTADDVDELLYDLGQVNAETESGLDVGKTEAPPGDQEMEEPAPDAAESTRGARVPWRRYHDSPLRNPPTHTGHASKEGKRRDAEPAERPAMDDEPDGPLLTPEELEALMREDFRTRPAIGPADHSTDEERRT